MPIKLNPCAKCGSTLIVRAASPDILSSLNWEYRTCASCGHTMSIISENGEEADAAWNAANTKEGNTDE